MSWAVRKLIHVNGIVQGVGFRPYVYRYAHTFKLVGTVLNSSQGVVIDIQGPTEQIDAFINHLKSHPPPLSRIDKFLVTTANINNRLTQFDILKSQTGTQATVSISSDKTICDDCLADLFDPQNRHYHYPFTNCTNCGPRYSLVASLPYDRPNTSMNQFTMCKKCSSAYHNPLDRRYHAQPISCPDCGPTLTLSDHQGQLLAEENAATNLAVESIREGYTVAVKGIGGFHLICDATNEQAVSALRQKKKRMARPLAVMVPDEKTAHQLVTGTKADWSFLNSKERPIVLMQKQDQSGIELAPSVAPAISKLGIFLPYSPLHALILQQLKKPIVATSANFSGDPIITTSEGLTNLPEQLADFILDHNREILNACDDSVVQTIDSELQVIRLARGYAPLHITLDRPIQKTCMALGAQQKNTVTFGFNNQLIVSPHAGDLHSVEAQAHFSKTVETFRRLYKLDVEFIAHDQHPQYFTTGWGQSFSTDKSKVAGVQHHYAHTLSVMAANQYRAKVLSFSFDGTGYGLDKTLWGGEVMIADAHNFKTVCCMKPVALFAGDKAINDPRKTLLAMLFCHYSPEQIETLNIPGLSGMKPHQIVNLYKIWKSQRHCINTSSAGRLFDAVACLLGLIENTQFEGQAGMLLEAAAEKCDSPEGQSLSLQRQGDFWNTEQLLLDITDKVTEKPLTTSRTQAIAKGFILALANAIALLAREHRALPVVLCGGVFQNKFLHENCIRLLALDDRKVLSPGLVPINDGGISLGQVWYTVNNLP